MELFINRLCAFGGAPPNVPTPTSQGLDDLGGDSGSQRDSNEDETLVNCIRQSQLSPYTWGGNPSQINYFQKKKKKKKKKVKYILGSVSPSSPFCSDMAFSSSGDSGSGSAAGCWPEPTT